MNMTFHPVLLFRVSIRGLPPFGHGDSRHTPGVGLSSGLETKRYVDATEIPITAQ
jgi:hypothetical protein